MGRSGHQKLAATRELDQFLQAGLSVVTKATVPVIHALLARTLWQMRQPTVPIRLPMKVVMSAVGHRVVSMMVRNAQTTLLVATLGGTRKPATAAPTATAVISA